MKMRIVFRGDNRTPAGADNIFGEGFKRRDLTAPKPVKRPIGANMAGDIEPTSAVCVSARITAAALFPLRFSRADAAISNTYIYVAAVDTAALTNTHQWQVIEGLKGVHITQDPKMSLWPLFGHELAIPEIPAEQIIAAVLCERRWRGDSWENGADYTLQAPVLFNQACRVEDDYLIPAKTFITDEVAHHAVGTTAEQESAYHVSEKK